VLGKVAVDPSPKIDNRRPQTGLNYQPGHPFSSLSPGPDKATTNHPHECPARKIDQTNRPGQRDEYSNQAENWCIAYDSHYIQKGAPE